MTIRYLHEGAGAADSDCTPAVGFNEKAVASPGNTSNLAHSVPSLTTELSHAWTTEAGSPNVADWPNGDYTGQINIAVFQISNFKIQIHRINSACASQVQLGVSGSLSGSGTHTFTVNTDPAAGAASDRYQIRINSTNLNTMPKTITCRVSQADPDDSFQEGPWVVAGGRKRAMVCG